MHTPLLPRVSDHGSELGFGAGIAQGYATLSQIGLSDRSGSASRGTTLTPTPHDLAVLTMPIPAARIALT